MFRTIYCTFGPSKISLNLTFRDFVVIEESVILFYFRIIASQKYSNISFLTFEKFCEARYSAQLSLLASHKILNVIRQNLNTNYIYIQITYYIIYIYSRYLLIFILALFHWSI
jgi:hypothetical protein